MSVLVPKIDKRTYNQIVAQVEALVETLTTAVPPTVEMLTGCILAQDLQDALGTIPAGTLLDAELAQRISRIPGLERVQVKGWDHSDSEKVDVSVEALKGRVLAQDIIETANGSERRIIPAGAILDAELIQRIRQIKDLDQVKVINHPPHRPRDAGGALIRIFGRFMELIVDCLNQVPEKNYLAFLNLIGADLLPPQPARVPLTFELAANSPVDALVPAGTQVAAPAAEGEEEDVIFETDQEMVVTRAQLKEVFGRNFDVELDQDLYSRVTPQALGTVDEPFDVFAGDQQVEHALYLACDALLNLPGKTDVTLRISAEDAPGLATYPMIWSYWDGEKEAWQEIARTPQEPPSIENDTWKVTLQDLPPLTASLVNGVEGGWLQGQLGLPLPPARADLALDAMASGASIPQDVYTPFYPFGDEAQATYLYLSCDGAFRRAGSIVTLDVKLATPGVADGLRLKWEFKKADDTWSELGQSGAESPPLGPNDFAFADDTQAFTKDGRIRFRVPPDRSWVSTIHRGRSGRWLRLTIVQGSYTQPPRIQSLTAAYDWDLPRIEHISLSPPEGLTLSPKLGFCNTLTLDLSKDFYPFGEQPRFNDTFYLSYEEVITKGGAKADDTITINVDLKDAGVAGGSSDPEGTNGDATNEKTLEIAWGFWDGEAWQALGQSSNAAESTGKDDYEFKDGTKAFTQTTGQISFKLPEQTAPTTVNGEQSYWLRARLVAGHYGLGPSYEEYSVEIKTDTTITAYKLIEANFKPPIVASLSYSVSTASEIALSSCQSYNDFTYVDHTDDNAQSKPFAPFTPSADTQPALYLGFDTRFDNRSVSLYAQVEPPQEKEVSPDSLAGMTITTRPQVTWEYANPDGGWTPLGALDETQGFASRGLIRFIGPRDFARRQLFGQELYWVRARWERGEGGKFAVPPRLRRLLLNTTWASQTTTIQNETLGSSNGNPGQTFQLVQVPVLPGLCLEVREPGMPSPAEQADIKKQEGQDAITTILDAAGHLEEIWVRWHVVPDFHGSGPRDRHYTVDHLTGTVRFGDGRYGLVPPLGQNNIRAARYRSGGGAGGNRPRETVIQLKSSVPHIDRVTNFEGASGGADRQPLDWVKRYGPRQLRHRGRAVTAQDLEDLAYAASADVARAKAIPPRHQPLDLWLDPGTDSPDTTAHGNVKEAGVMGLIVVPRSDSPQPTPSLGLLEQVKAYLLARCPATAELWVAGPDWVKVTVSVTAVPTSLAMADVIGARLRAALERFLHPLTGGPQGKGWPFGCLPHRSDLYALIKSVEGVDHVRALTIETAKDIPLSEQSLIYSGQHEINLVPD